ncbi:cytochrome P450 [Streptomyces prunicolor]|uniref:cytochrome P450 n=1 Tax=Streptomyces prunicolor TaxID=67348 RepID=UPI003424D373
MEAETPSPRPDGDELFNPRSESFIRDPYSRYDRLRSLDPVHFDARLNGWLVSRYADVDALLRDSAMGRAGQRRFFGHFDEGGSIDLASRSWLLNMDPPDHTRIRRQFGKAFTRQRVESLRPYVEQKVDVLLDRIAADGGCEFVSSVAQPLPVALICMMLGVPEERHEICRDHSSALLPLLDPVISEAQQQRAEEACAWFLEYFGELAEQRRRDPKDDLLSALLPAEGEGELARHELINNIIFLFSAGHETTSSLLGNGLYALLTHPDQYAALAEDPGLAPEAVSEMLRWDAPVQYFGRRATADTKVGDRQLRPGDIVMGLVGAANRDPERFKDPHRFDIGRPDCQPVSFGAGIHYCIGAALSKMESEALFARLPQRFPGMRLVAEPERRSLMAVRSFKALDIAV